MAQVPAPTKVATDSNRVSSQAPAEGGVSGDPGSQGKAKPGLISTSQDADQNAEDPCEELKSQLAVRDSCLKKLQSRLEAIQGSSKVLLTEEALFSSQSIKTIIAQVNSLLSEVERRENLEI